MLFMKRDRAFERFYAEELVPFWTRYGERPDRKAAVQIFRDAAGKADPRLITQEIWNGRVIPYFNDTARTALSDANLSRLFSRGLSRPKTLFRRMGNGYCLDDYAPISGETAIELCRTPGEWVAVPAMGEPGRFAGRFAGGAEETEIRALLKSLYGQDYIVRSRVRPHPSLSAFSAGDEVLLGLTTLMLGDAPDIRSAVVRCAEGDKLSECEIRDDGSLGSELAVYASGAWRHAAAPAVGPIPRYETVKEQALQLALRYPYAHLVTWYFAVSDSGEVLFMGFDAKTPRHHQELCGPAFGDRTEEVLSAVYASRLSGGTA